MADTKGQRQPGDDFFCFRYQLWYSLDDCAFRHYYRTFEGCIECAQGAMNLTRLPTPQKPRYTEIPRPAAGR